MSTQAARAPVIPLDYPIEVRIYRVRLDMANCTSPADTNAVTWRSVDVVAETFCLALRKLDPLLQKGETIRDVVLIAAAME